MSSSAAMEKKVEGRAAFAEPVACGDIDDVVADAELRPVLVATPALADVELTTDEGDDDEAGEEMLGVLLGVLLAELLALLDDTLAIADDFELTTKEDEEDSVLLAMLDATLLELTPEDEEDKEDGVLLAMLDATLLELTPEDEEDKEDGVLLAMLDAALLELTTEDEEDIDCRELLLVVVVWEGELVELTELIIAAIVFVFAAAWLVTTTLGVCVEEATLSVARTGITVPVLVDTRSSCADCTLQKLMKGWNSGSI